MPPKKASRAKGTDSAPSTPGRRSVRLSPAMGVSALPHIPTKHSFAYGSSATPILPHMLAAKPQMKLKEMASTIEDAVQEAKDRETIEVMDSPSMSTRSRMKSTSLFSSPRIPQRQPTPDQVQLLDSLRRASASPERYLSDGTLPNTPPSPVRHSFSTSTSPEWGLPAQQLYPPQMQEPLRGLGIENSSVVSWDIERAVHDDNLTRTRSNITAPPRRFSGLAFGEDPIEEEHETTYNFSDLDGGFVGGAPARTIIPDHFIPEPPTEEYPTEVPKEVPQTRWNYPGPKDGYLAWLLRFLLIGSLVVFAYYTYQDAHARRDLPVGGKAPGRANNAGMDMLSNQVVKLGAQVSSLSKDMRSMKSEVSELPGPTTIVQYAEGGKGQTHLEKHMTNFLSIGSGVIIDPYITSPTVAPSRSKFKSLYMWIARTKHLHQQPPLAALTPWEDFGECWCSALKDTGMSQLGIILGRRIIPKEVVVEHMPKGATLKPEVAPRQMELWARYRYVANGARPYRWSISAILRGMPSNIAGQDTLTPDRKALRGPVMEALRLAWRGESDDKFSNDPHLGQDFYRIGKWNYDINDPTHIQKFPVHVVLDSDELRVDKVVFRVNSNWGGNETCLYRLKLHGQL
ncbi:hypothetical protein BDW59DRAFT_141732 [Aspergillus cavernicola]|uniref:SUN domain-containing protein n=1 Tax=Aspergillus cavernicola TaxID=176166 RepID=A0ABR4IQM1_9EURO